MVPGRNHRNRARGGKEFTGPRKGVVPGKFPCVWSQREPSEPIPNPALRGPKPGPHCTMAAGTLCRPAGQQPRQARSRAEGQEEGSTQAIPILPVAGLACRGQPRKSSGRGTMTGGLEVCLLSALASLHSSTDFPEGNSAMGQKLSRASKSRKRR